MAVLKRNAPTDAVGRIVVMDWAQHLVATLKGLLEPPSPPHSQEHDNMECYSSVLQTEF